MSQLSDAKVLQVRGSTWRRTLPRCPVPTSSFTRPSSEPWEEEKNSRIEGPTRTSSLIKTPRDEVVAGGKRLYLHTKILLLKH